MTRTPDPAVGTTPGEPVLPADPPPIAGLGFRRFRDADDYAALARVITAANLADGIDYVPTADNLRVDAENDAGFDPSSGYLLAEIDGELVAWGAGGVQVRDGVAVYEVSGGVHPDWRRRRLGTTIVRRVEEDLRQIAGTRIDAGGRTYGAWSSVRMAGADRLFAGLEYSPVRYGFDMIRDLTARIPDVALPAGLELQPVLAEHHRAIFDADFEAFRDHWGHREPTDEDFAAILGQAELDARLWRVAWDGEQVAGSVQSYIWHAENEALGVRRGWLERVSVRRPWRRRGLARALIASALAGLRDAGMTEAMLGVDAENPTGALGLYDSLDFRVKDWSVTYRKAF